MRPPSRHRYLSVASSLSTSATTMSPSRAVSARLLRGAAAVLQRDRPIFTVEMALGDAKASQTLLEEVEAQGFRAYMVPEVCGLNRDCRNFICVPSEQPLTDRLLVQSTVPVEAKSFDPSALMRVPIIRPESKT